MRMPRVLPLVLALSLAGSAGSAVAAPASTPSTDWHHAAEIVRSIDEPDIPARTVDVTDYGAVGDGSTDARPAIEAALADMERAGGGRVVLPPGTWFSAGPIRLRSHVDLHVSSGATLRFSEDPADYLPVVPSRWEGTEMFGYSPLLHAHRVHDVAVTGGGLIDGNAEDGFAAWRELQGEDQQALRRMGKEGVPVEERVFGEGHYLRPSMLQFYESSDVLVEGVTIVDAPMWVNHFIYSDDITVRDVTVKTHRPNNDGVAIDSSSDVLVENNDFQGIGDDCVVVKSGRDEDGRRVGRPSENIVVRGNRMSGTEGGFAIGSEMSGGVNTVFVERNTMDTIGSALYIKANLDRGGVVERVRIRDITVGTAEKVLRFQTDYSGYQGGNHPPAFRDFVVENVRAGIVSDAAITAVGVPSSPVRDVTVRRMWVDQARIPLELKHTENVHLHNVWIGGQRMDDAEPTAG
ncbi:endopolygalacturonase [Saccharomonospora cyanea NA-134]|uniref:Endopolygalacturonase n=2 Tax=Saccharomonospora cyanea TaxID=40989 RepID=H5XG09_9PSEU|nr:endopolygalacturonase [Saccharomonospora cyanea NA-134]